MGKAQWGSDPEFFGPRHAHREARILRRLRKDLSLSGPHIECAAGVGSLSAAIVQGGREVVAADASLRSLLFLKTSAGPSVLPVVADITQLPFDDRTFASASTAETLEHIPDDKAAVGELARVLKPGGVLVGTVPAGPEQWSDWDDWAGHLRRYTKSSMEEVLSGAGLRPRVIRWGWPILRMYDDFFLKRVNRRRLHHDASSESDSQLNQVLELGRKRWLVRLVRGFFALDRFFDGTPWGVGILFSGFRESDPQ